MKKRKQDSEKVNSKTRQQARRNFIKKLGVASAAAVTGVALPLKGSDDLLAQGQILHSLPVLEKPSLILKMPGLHSGLTKLFRALRKSETREQFIHNPAKAISRYLPSLSLTATEVSHANRFLFSILANDKFKSWALSYQQEQMKAYRKNPDMKLSRNQITQDLARAYAEFGDKDLLLSLVNPLSLRAAPPKSVAISNYIHTHTVILQVGWAIILVVLTAIDFTPIVDRPEDVDFALSPAEMGAIADQLIARAKELRKSGALFDPEKELD